MNNIITENEKSSPSPLKEGGKTGTPPTPEAIKTNPNQDNPNPYFRRYGSHVNPIFPSQDASFLKVQMMIRKEQNQKKTITM